MPYIKVSQRGALLPSIRCLARKVANNEGALNYAITKLILESLPKNPKYRDYNAVFGALECIKQEMYRRVVSHYEDKKIKEHGDVY